MTVSSDTNSVTYSGNGSTTVFPYSFKIFENTDLIVTLIDDATEVETVQTLTTDYTVSGAGNNSGGNVTFVTAPASGKTVKIERNLAFTQTTVYTENDAFPAKSHEDALDRLTMLTQQNKDKIDAKAPKESPTFTGTVTIPTAAITTFSLGGTNVTSTATELNILDGVTATATELNILDGVTSTTAELNILDGVTSTTAELNILDGVTATTAELNILDGVTSTTAELNILDGVTATTAELNYLDITTLGTSEASKVLTTDSSNNVNFTNDITLSGGAVFGTTGGNVTSKTLDDYEEGTWSPVYGTTLNNFTTMTMDVISATYTKIGNTVIATAYIQTDDVDNTGATGSITIEGLPFTATETSAVAIGFANNFAIDHPISGYVSGTKIVLQKRTTVDGDTNSLQYGDLTNGTIANQNQLIFTAIYKA